MILNDYIKKLEKIKNKYGGNLEIYEMIYLGDKSHIEKINKSSLNLINIKEEVDLEEIKYDENKPNALLID